MSNETVITAQPGEPFVDVVRESDGSRFAFRGVFHSVTPREQITQTFEFLGAPGHVNLDRVSFEDLGGSTRITTRTAFQSVESRDAMVAAGMAMGMTEGYERMDELLASLG